MVGVFRKYWVLLITVLVWALALPLSDAAADARHPETSRILEIDDAFVPDGWSTATVDTEAPPFDAAGYRRPDMLEGIYGGDFRRVPAAGLDNMRYFATAYAELNAACPALGLGAAKLGMLPYVFTGQMEMFDRFMRGDLSQSEAVQMAWMGVLGLSKQWSCTWTPSTSTRYTAQQACDAAERARRDLSVLPSADARADLGRFRVANGCSSPRTRRLARQMIAFGQVAHRLVYGGASLPDLSTPRGAAYQRVLGNCLRGKVHEKEYNWCRCYVSTLHRLDPDPAIVAALAENPFVDGGSYMSWVAANVPGGGALYACADKHLRGTDSYRTAYRPRATACLIDETRRADGGTTCAYRAAWGTFTMTKPTCAPAIDSHSWGGRAVDCAAGGALAAPADGPRRWQDGAFTRVDYESRVPDAFVPPLPADAPDNVPFVVRLLERDAPGRLVRMSLMPLRRHMVINPPDDPFHPLVRKVDREVAIIDRAGQLMLVCDYKGTRGYWRYVNWYRMTPRRLAEGRVDPTVAPYLRDFIGGPYETCPARKPD